MEKTKEVLLASTSFETPIISTKEWLVDGNEMMLSYMGMIAIAGSIVLQHDPEEVAYSISGAISKMIGTGDPLLFSRFILICKQEDNDCIEAYCSAHKIPIDIFINKEPMVLVWSTWRANCKTPLGKLNRPISYH